MPMQVPLLEKGCWKDQQVTPLVRYNVSAVMELVKEGHRTTTGGDFPKALRCFREVLNALTLAVAETSEEEQQLLDIVDMCREYVTAMRLEVTRKELPPTDVKRSMELGA